MTDLRPVPAAAPRPPDAADRGSLDVRTRAIRTLVEQAALETPGTLAHRAGLGRLTGQSRTTVTMHGRSARVATDVACAWPCDVTRIATDVRARVRELAARYSGVHIASVDVTVHVVAPGDGDAPRRRVE